MSFPVIVPDAVEVERDAESRVTYLYALGASLAVEDVPDGAADITLTVPVALLRALRALVTHPQVAALLDAAEATAHPPVA